MPPIDIDPYLLDAPLGSPSRPSWRGRLHLIALWSAIPLLVGLAIESGAARSRAAVIVFAVGLCSMLLVSTTYHRWVHTIRARAIWRRADHAAIFAAAIYTFVERPSTEPYPYQTPRRHDRHRHHDRHHHRRGTHP